MSDDHELNEVRNKVRGTILQAYADGLLNESLGPITISASGLGKLKNLEGCVKVITIGAPNE